MESQEFELLTNMKCFEIYNPACYYSVIRGGPCYWVSSFSAYKTDEKARRAALVSVLSVKFRLVFDEAMIFALIPADFFEEIKKTISGKHYSDFGLNKMFAIVGNTKEEVELEKIPSIQYTTNVNVLGKTDKLAYEAYSSGATSFTAWGSVVQFEIPEVRQEGLLNIKEVDVDQDEEEIVEASVSGIVSIPQDVLLVVPRVADVVKNVGWLGSTVVQVEVRTPEYGKKTFELYGDTPSIVHFRCDSVYEARYKHKVSYARKWVRDIEATPSFEDEIFENKFSQVFKRFMGEVSAEMLRVRKKIGGWSRVSRRMYEVLKDVIFPVSMPSLELMAMCMVVIRKYAIIWESRKYSWYNCLGWRYFDCDDFESCLSQFPQETCEPDYYWENEGPMTYEQYEAFARYDSKSEFYCYDDDMVNDELMNRRYREALMEECTLDDVCFIESEEFASSSDHEDLEYFERDLLGD